MFRSTFWGVGEGGGCQRHSMYAISAYVYVLCICTHDTRKSECLCTNRHNAKKHISLSVNWGRLCATRMNLYNLIFQMVVLIKKMYLVRDFNFCLHPPTSSGSGHFIYIPHKNWNHTNCDIKNCISGQPGVP